MSSVHVIHFKRCPACICSHLVGWLARKLKILGETALTELNRFVVYGVTCFAFRYHCQCNVGRSGSACVYQCLFDRDDGGVFLTLFVQLRRTRHLADAAIDALNAGYANTGFIGFPLVIVFRP